jgi:hypothetical protein
MICNLLRCMSPQLAPNGSSWLNAGSSVVRVKPDIHATGQEGPVLTDGVDPLVAQD